MNYDNLLIKAACKNEVVVAKNAIANGANVRAHNNTALYWAVCKGYTKMVKLLLDSGADARSFNVVRVIKDGHIEIAKLLLDHGASTKDEYEYEDAFNDYARPPEVIAILSLSFVVNILCVLYIMK